MRTPMMIDTARRGLALVRIGLGVLFVVSAWDKTTKGWWFSARPLIETVRQNLPKTEGFYRPFLEGTVLPHALVFARLVTLGEWVAGVSLLLGLLTPVGALAAMWLLLHYMAMKGTLLHGFENPLVYSDRLYFLGALGSLIGAAGLAWGADALLRPWLSGMRPRTGRTGRRHIHALPPSEQPRPLRPAAVEDRLRRAA
jgi:uncharacterized membrane protein YphA (DoxX/SURF4 family)